MIIKKALTLAKMLMSKHMIYPGGGGTLTFSSYVGSGLASTVQPPPPQKKYQEFQAPQNNIWNFTNPQKYPPFCTLTLRKDPKTNRNNLLI